MSYVATKPAWLSYTVDGFGAVSLPTGFNLGGGAWCGTPIGVQQMLADLGFYMGPIDGNIQPGDATVQAMDSYRKSKNLSAIKEKTYYVCQALRDDWLKLQSGGRATNLSLVGGKVALKTPTRVVFSSTTGGSGSSGGASSETPTADSGATTESSSITEDNFSCPPGYTGIAPACIPIPQKPGEGSPPQVEPMCTGWWNCKDDTTKALIIGGSVAGVATVGLVAFLVLRK